MQILAPTECPCCNSSLVFVNDRLYCKNSSCPAKTGKSIEHFAKTMKIKGLGPATIEKLELSSIVDVYDLTKDYMLFMLESEKVVDKLIEEIEKSKKQPLNIVLPAFGISLIGNSAAEKLSKVCDTIFDINDETISKAGLGPKAKESLLDWIENDFYLYENLEFDWSFEKSTAVGSRGSVCITGKLKSFPTKTAAKTALEQAGFIVQDSVTKTTTILINESGIESAKTQKARQNGITVIENIQTLLEI